MRTLNELNRRKERREIYSTEAELYLESSIFRARVVDHSSGGVRFEMEKPVNFLLRFKIGEKRISRNARLVWLNEDEEGIMSYGFKYLNEHE